MRSSEGFPVGLTLLLASLSVLLTCEDVAARRTTHPGRRPISVHYDAPKDQALREISVTMRERHVLERVAAILDLVRLPRRLTYRLSECSGEPNAWYDPRTHAVTVCYELIGSILRLAPATTSPAGVTRDDAVRGPVLQILFHESSHALFDLLRIPVLGREEDGADQVASLILLHLTPAQARTVVNGSAYFFATLGKHEPIDRGSFADAHGLSWQRFYNLACLAYGSDRRRYGYIVEKGYLPPERAKTCKEEYNQVNVAFQALIGPHLRVCPRHGQALRRAFSKMSGARRHD
ncbi:DUF4344 domain-containing metallopeptidase [Methylobacterium planeticum]|uniref:Metallopeptidase n=1 Tax=Methylobacterium planeticum TaxID=2615211 RepID=A0A6N6MQI6_9HYPH|nr:DUF4344 domain-containing metallopeptidase [Methylobacterium planeticum]KAB1072334.1 hypothetical protein F6X51_16670 [Methylobacterium planeticum]